MVQIYANFEGLSRKLNNIGWLKSPQELHTFARAFSCNQPLFSFVDVGMGKERADHKLKEMFRLFFQNVQCKHIIFGGCHDNGYIPKYVLCNKNSALTHSLSESLEQYSHDPTAKDRISLLESTTAEYGYQSLGFNIIRFRPVFRSEPLPESHFPSRSLPSRALETRSDGHLFSGQEPEQENKFPSRTTPVSTPAIPSTNTQQQRNVFSPDPATTIQPSGSHTPQTNPTSTSHAPANATGPDSNNPPPTVPPPTYAKAGPQISGVKTISIAPTKSAAPRKFIFINANQQRIDRPLPKPDETATRALAIRM